MLGLVAERATETMRREISEFVEPGVRHPGAPYLGPIVTDPHGLVRRVEVARILSGPHGTGWSEQSEEHEWLSLTSSTC